MDWYKKNKAQIQENRIVNELRRGDSRSYKSRVDAAYDRLPFRRPVEAERPARPITVSSPVYKPRPMTPADYKGGPIIDNKTGKPVNAPKGFNQAAKAYGTKRFPALFASVLRRNPMFTAADLLQMFAQYFDKQPKSVPNKDRPPFPPSPYHYCQGPFPMNVRPVGGYFVAGNGACNFSSTLYNQAPYTPHVGKLTNWNHYVCRNHIGIAGLVRTAIVGAMRTTTTASVRPPLQPYTPIASVANPNVLRHSAGTANIVDPTIRNVHDRMDKRESDYIADRQIRAMARGLVRRQIPHARIPPARGVRESKALSKLARFGIALAKVMDTVSESAEIIDAVYDALPQDVKDRWEKGVSYEYSVYDGVRQGDNYGQYGIDGADWKVRAIYYNWRKVDIQQAARNIVKNHVSDKIIGKYQSGMPVNLGNAVGSGEMKAAQIIDKSLDRAIDFILNGR